MDIVSGTMLGDWHRDFGFYCEERRSLTVAPRVNDVYSEVINKYMYLYVGLGCMLCHLVFAPHFDHLQFDDQPPASPSLVQ